MTNMGSKWEMYVNCGNRENWFIPSCLHFIKKSLKLQWIDYNLSYIFLHFKAFKHLLNQAMMLCKEI